MTESVYIHIPFCKSKCKYCSFVSFENHEKKKGYIYSLLKEIDYYYSQEELKTFYVGGGTPSLLDISDLKKILSKFNFADDCEKTIELNPNDINEEYLNGLKTIGFNRLSIGSQSFDDHILQLIGRRHSSDEIYKSVEIARKVGFENISLDLIYGLPTQTLESFRHDLEQIFSINVEHISLYGLKIDEGCYFYKHQPDNLPDDDIQADMYLLAGELAAKNGFEHYEISNYSKPNYYSRHNTNYWKCGEYYGFGVSAHGYVGGIRYSNYSTLDKYMSEPTAHEYGQFLTEKEKLEEKIFLGLRLKKGINIQEINSEFEIDFEMKYQNVLEKYISSGHFIETKDGYALSDNKDNNGFLISNVILSEFI
ncbi:MAG: radical SAM family heme chaperone HemW [Candidatus Gastranaerophilales bacterium]|nr:radical SAM family heme chaperone HemW [Candidatus Gastranaerophilales bacterium]